MDKLNFTPEQRQENFRLAKIARERKKEEGKHLKQDWVDNNYFRECASKVGYRLASSHIPASEVKHVKRLLKHLDRSIDWWYGVTGFSKLTDFYELNPNAPAWYYQSLVIEAHLDEIK